MNVWHLGSAFSQGWYVLRQGRYALVSDNDDSSFAQVIFTIQVNSFAYNSGDYNHKQQVKVAKCKMQMRARSSTCME